MKNSIDRGSGYAEFPAKACRGHVAASLSPSDFSHLSFGQHGVRVVSAGHTFTTLVALGQHVADIVGLRTGTKVRGINTSWNVYTGACMENRESFGDGADVQLVGKPVRGQSPMGSLTGAELTIAFPVFRANPQPAGIRLYDVLPEPCLVALGSVCIGTGDGAEATSALPSSRLMNLKCLPTLNADAWNAGDYLVRGFAWSAAIRACTRMAAALTWMKAPLVVLVAARLAPRLVRLCRSRPTGSANPSGTLQRILFCPLPAMILPVLRAQLIAWLWRGSAGRTQTGSNSAKSSGVLHKNYFAKQAWVSF